MSCRNRRSRSGAGTPEIARAAADQAPIGDAAPPSPPARHAGRGPYARGRRQPRGRAETSEGQCRRWWAARARGGARCSPASQTLLFTRHVDVNERQLGREQVALEVTYPLLRQAEAHAVVLDDDWHFII